MWKIIILLLLIPTASFSADKKVFTDADLEQYPSSEGAAPRIQSEDNSNPSNTPADKERNEAEQWCQRATAAKDRLERAQHALANSFMTSVRTSDKYGRKYSGSQAVTEAEIEQNNAETEVREAKDAYESLKEEATRKNIPPGWLYCNY